MDDERDGRYVTHDDYEALERSLSEAVSRADSFAHKLERDAVLLSAETKARIELERSLAEAVQERDRERREHVQWTVDHQRDTDAAWRRVNDAEKARDICRDAALSGSTQIIELHRQLRASAEYAVTSANLLRDARAHVAESLDDIIDTEDRDIIQKLLDDIDTHLVHLSIQSTREHRAAGPANGPDSHASAGTADGAIPSSRSLPAGSAEHFQAFCNRLWDTDEDDPILQIPMPLLRRIYEEKFIVEAPELNGVGNAVERVATFAAQYRKAQHETTRLADGVVAELCGLGYTPPKLDIADLEDVLRERETWKELAANAETKLRAVPSQGSSDFSTQHNQGGKT